VEGGRGFGPENLGVPAAEIRRELRPRPKNCGHVGSIGQRRRTFFPVDKNQLVAIAGVLAMQPEALILDEPTRHVRPYRRRGSDGYCGPPEPR